MQFNTILSLAAAATLQLVFADVHSACWCEIDEEFDLRATSLACRSYPKEDVFDVKAEKVLEDVSIVEIRMSNSTNLCTSYNKKTVVETPYLGGKEFSEACEFAAAPDANVESLCN